MKEKFFYRGIRKDGKEEGGVVEASTREEALQWVRGQGLIPLEVAPLARRSFSGLLWERVARKRDRLSLSEVHLFTRQMAMLLRGGFPVDRALVALSESLGDRRVGEFCRSLLLEVEKGASLSEALGKNEEFSPMYVTLVRAGERSGTLERVMDHLSRYLEEEIRARKEIVSALIYPSLLLAVGVISVYLLLVLVIPRFSLIFADLGQEIPLPTRMMLQLSSLARRTWFLLPLVLVGGVVLVRMGLKRPAWRRKGEEWVLYRAPLVGLFIRRRELSRFFRAMAILLEGGIPLSRALELTVPISSFWKVREELGRLAEEIKKGRSLSRLMSETRLFPPFCVHMVGVGEETGALEEAFLNVAVAFEEEVRDGTRRFLNLLEPSIILCMGVVVGSIVISMLLAIFGINEVGF